MTKRTRGKRAEDTPEATLLMRSVTLTLLEGAIANACDAETIEAVWLEFRRLRRGWSRKAFGTRTDDKGARS